MARILSITPYKYAPPENGGHHGVILVDKLLGIQNSILNLSTKNNSTSYPLEVETSFTLPDSKKRYFPFFLTNPIDTKIKEFKATHLFIHHHYLFPAAYKAARKNQIPLYIRSHNIESERFRSLGKKWWRLMYFFEKYAYKKSDKIFFVTDEDKNWAIHHYQIHESKCIVMPFGIECHSKPEFSESRKQMTAQALGIRGDVPWIFFMGKLDYPPNAQALQSIVRNIYPILQEKLNDFELILFGKNVQVEIEQEIFSLEKKYNNIHFLGFIPDIEDLLSCSDIMLNPVNFGGGVKTKVVEAIAWDNTVISSKTGAIGMEYSKCGSQLIPVDDEDWNAYVDQVINVLKDKKTHSTPIEFYEYYSLEKIAERVQIHF